MPFEPECVEKHRNQAHLTCGACSDNHSFTLTRMGQMEGISERIIDCAAKLPEWREHRARIAYTVTLIINEACLNAIEHGVLGIGKEKKRALVARHGDKYLAWVEEEWLASHTPITVTACINEKRILIGVHDSGAGFDPVKGEMTVIADADLLELSGRGIVILKGMGIKLRWNKEGNTILCSYHHSNGAN